MKENCISILKKIKNTLLEKNLLKIQDRILLAFSGGQDSICLVFIFLQLKTQWNFNIGIICCQHLWQFESLYLFEYVVEILYFFDIPILFPITLYPILSEEKSRIWRYNTFSRLGIFENYKIIVTGHTATDKLETCIFNFIRGSAIEGLLSLHWKRILLNNNFFFENTKQTKKNFYTDELFLIDFYIDNNFFIYIKNKKIRFEKPISTMSQFESKIKSCTQKVYWMKKALPFQFSQNHRLEWKLSKIVSLKKNFKFDLLTTKNKYSIRKIMLKKGYSSQYQGKAILRKFVNVNYNKFIPFSHFYHNKRLKYPFKKPFEITIIRPFLNIHRIELYQLCLFWKLLIFQDKTNTKLKYYRNRIRKQLLPLLRYFFNPNVDIIVNRFTELVVSENLYLDFVSKKLCKILTNAVESTETTILLDLSIIRYLPVALQRRIIKKILENFYNCKLQYIYIEKLLSLVLKIPSQNLQNKKITKLGMYSVNSMKYLFLPKTGLIRIFSQGIVLIKSE